MSTTKSRTSPDQRGNSTATCNRRAKLPSTPSMQTATPSQTNTTAHWPLTKTVRDNKAPTAPQDGNTCTPKATAERAEHDDSRGVSESTAGVYMLSCRSH